MRLAQDAASGRLIALASKDIHQRIEQTIAKLEGEVPVFEALQLKRVEPYVAISVIREMFDIPFFTDDEVITFRGLGADYVKQVLQGVVGKPIQGNGDRVAAKECFLRLRLTPDVIPIASLNWS